MVDMKQSNYEFSLRPPYLSELAVPSHITVIDNNSSCLNVGQCSSASCSLEETCSIDAYSKVSSDQVIRKHSSGKMVDCKYKAAGCTERVPQGTLAEAEHYENCQYRPIPCLMQHVCNELVPFHNFLLHHMQHFIYPTFSNILNTSVVFQREDFDCNHQWQPRWMNCHDKHFFVKICHKIPGMWYFWVGLLGTQEESNDFTYDIEVSKAYNRKIGTFSVLPLRTTEDELQKRELCLSMTDYQVKRISQIKDNLVGSLDVDLAIHKISGSSISRFWLGVKQEDLAL